MNLISLILKKMIQFKIRGSGRLTKILCKSGLITFKTSDQVRLLLNPYDYIDHKIITSGYFDQEVVDIIDQQVRPGDCFWDIGSHIGLHSLTLQARHKDLKVKCFEPSNHNFRRLLLNRKLNERWDISLFQIGIGSANEIVDFSQNDINSGMSGIEKKIQGYQIPVFSIDQLIEMKIQPPTIIKIDVEGFELEVFRGMKKLLNSGKLRLIVFETYQYIDQITNFIKQYQYNVSRIEGKDDYVAFLINN